MASLAERTASPWTATSMRDRPAGCSTCASSLCGAVCGNGPVAGSRRRWFVGADRMAARIRRRAGDDGPNAPRCDQHDTRRHPATFVSFWDGDRSVACLPFLPAMARSELTLGLGEDALADQVARGDSEEKATPAPPKKGRKRSEGQAEMLPVARLTWSLSLSTVMPSFSA